MNINFSTSFQIPKPVNKTNKYSTNPIHFRGGDKPDSLKLQPLTPEAEAQYQEQKVKTEEQIKQYEESIPSYKDGILINEKEIDFYKEIINPDKPFYNQLINLIENRKAFEEEYQAKIQELHDVITYKAFMNPKWQENIISVLKKYNPDYQNSQDSQDLKGTSRKFLTDLVNKTRTKIEADFARKNKLATDAFKKNCSEILTPYFVDNDKKTLNVNALINNVSKTLLKTKNINSVNDLIKACEVDIKSKTRSIESVNSLIREQKEALLTYRKYLLTNPKIAPYYKPFQNRTETCKELIDSGACINSKDIVDEYFANTHLCQLADMGLIKLLPYTVDSSLVDLTDETSMQTAQMLKEKKGRLKTFQQIKKEYNISDSYIVNTNLPIVNFISKSNNPNSNKVLMFFEINDTSKKALEEQQTRYNRTRHIPLDKYYYSGNNPPKERYISATLLKKLGFFPAKGLVQLVKSGKLQGYTKQVETKDGPATQAYIDLSDPDNIQKLIALRDKNKTTLSLCEFAKAAGITQKNLMENIKDGNVDIIKEVILCMDLDHIYIDLNVEKNRQFLFEKELEQQLKKEQAQQERQEKELERINNKDLKERYLSLRMKLVWHFCPQTKQIASEIASQDGYLCRLLEKDNNDEELTQHEKVKINSYRKNLWLTAGTDELKEGFKKADEILNTYKTAGIDAIEDENIKNIIKLYFD